MTREEAIKILKAIRVYECYPKSASEETKEAIDMAIEALSAENSNAKTQNSNQETQKSNGDLIKRADAIEAVCRKCSAETRMDCALGKCFCCDRRELEALPSADAEQETVPTVVRVTMSDGSQYYLEHECDALQADAVHGEWHQISPARIYECSICNHNVLTDYIDTYNYCPSCGARMYKGGDDE